MKRGVFSKLYRDAVLLVTHSNDQDYERILFLLLYELLQQYLLLQSSQWHTIVSKQFYLYEETGKEPSDKADGVETIVYLLQFVLFHLPGLEVTLSGNTVEENILAYFCTMLSDRLRAEPYLFNTYIYLLAAIASTSSTSADAVYAFIDKAPSEHVSWPIMVSALNEAEKLLQSEGAQRGLLDPDLTGFIAILTLLKSIILNTTSCPTIRSSLQANTIQVCLKLLHQPIHVVLKAKLCEVLAAIAREESYTKTILKQLEYGRILTADSNTGIAWELESVETAAQAYPLTTSFLELLLALLRTLGAKTILKSDVFPSILRYTLRCVFLKSEERHYSTVRSGERWHIDSLCCEIMNACVRMVHEASGNAVIEERAWTLVSELLSGGEAMKKLLQIPQMALNHTVVSTTHMATDCIAESSVLVEFRLLDMYPCQIDLVHQTLLLLRHLLTITPETISQIGLRYQVPSSSMLVTSLASHLLTETRATIAILLHITNTKEPVLQLLAMQILRLLADQVKTDLFLAIFDSYPCETQAICAACNDLVIASLFTTTQDAFSLSAQLDSDPSTMMSTMLSAPSTAPLMDTSRLHAETCRVFLDLLVTHASCEFPSVVTLLLSLPRALSTARQENSLQSVIATLISFLHYPSLIPYHPVLASKVCYLFYLLCSHQEVPSRIPHHV